MPQLVPPTRLGAVVGVAVAGAAASAALGVAAQRNAARKILRRPDPDADQDFETLPGTRRTVRTDDGVHINVSIVDEIEADLTIIFTHGYALDARAWHYQLRDLADVGRLVVWDQRGHGRSERGDDTSFTVDRFARDLLAVVNEVAPEGPIVLVGHSMGGMAVMQLGAEHPDLFGDRVVGVVLLASAANLGDRDLVVSGPLGRAVRWAGPGLAVALRGRGRLVERGLSMADDLVVVLTQHYGFGSQASPSHVELTKRMHANVPIDVLVACMSAFDDLDLVHGLRALQHVEAVVVTGESDVMAPPRLSAMIVRELPSADLVVLADTGHMLMLERHAEVNEVIRELVVRVRRTLRAA